MNLSYIFVEIGSSITPSTNPNVLCMLLEWWRMSVDTNYGVWCFWWIGLLASVAGILVWVWIFWKVHRRGKVFKLLPFIVAHVHHREVNAAHHIIGSLLAFSGVSLVVGFVWAELFRTNTSDAGYIMTNAGTALGVLTLILTIWTLNQTMKLERLHGDSIDRFDELIREMTDQINDLVKRYDENRDKSSGLYRVILVTNNPYFGIISYKGRPVTQNYETAFHSVITRVEEEKGKAENCSGFRVKVICADEANLREFVAQYSCGRDDEERMQEAGEKSEKFINDIQSKAGPESVVRIPTKVSEAQFAVIGDVVFEFFLEPSDHRNILWKTRGSNIRATNKIHDRGAADRFERFAMFLEELVSRHDNLCLHCDRQFR